MQHTFFALFDDIREAEAALQALSEDPRLGDRVSVLVHRDKLQAKDVDFIETDTRRGAVMGAALGGVGGAILAGLALGPAGLFGAGPLFSALAGLGGGSILGLLTGAIAGTERTDHRLEDLAGHLAAGRILITVKVTGLGNEEEVEALFRRHGALEARKGWL